MKAFKLKWYSTFNFF